MLSAFIKVGGNVKSPVNTGTVFLPGQPPRAPAASAVQLVRKMPRPRDVASDSRRLPHPAAGFVRRSPAQKGRPASRAMALMDPPAVHQAPLAPCNARSLTLPLCEAHSTTVSTGQRTDRGPGRAGAIFPWLHGQPGGAGVQAQVCWTESLLSQTPCHWVRRSRSAPNPLGDALGCEPQSLGPRGLDPKAARGSFGRTRGGRPARRAQRPLDAARRGCRLCRFPGLLLVVA